VTEVTGMTVRLYTYEVRDTAGNSFTGQMQAADPGVVAQHLRDQGYLVMRVSEPQPQPAETVRGPRRRPGGRVNPAILAQFYREFATMIGSGMTVIQALHTLDDTISHPTVRWAVRGLRQAVERGQRLSENMRNFPEVFSPLAVAVVAAGEQSGRLDEMLGVMADYAERDLELRRLLNRETFYPKILLFAILTIVPGGLTVATTIARGIGAGLRWLAPILGVYVLALLLGVVIYYMIRAYGQSQQGRLGIDRLKLAVPVFGSLANRIAMSRFCRALAALYSAGVPMPQSMRLAGEASANTAVSHAVSAMVFRVEQGGKLSEALAQTGLVPQLVLSMIRTGEQTGDIDQVLHKVADYYDDETKTKIHQLSQTIVPICVVIGGIIVFIIAALFFLNFYGGLLSAVGN
jgi:type IV pilus assembly protein PilC